MSAQALQEATIEQHCKALRMPTIASQCVSLAEQATRERQTHLGYLEALLQAELEERETNTVQRRLREARLPRMKTLEEFDFSQAPKVSAVQMQELAQGGYIETAEPVILIGRLWYRQDPSVDGAVCGRMPSEAASAICHSGCAGE